jgi:hypothetical protein
MTAGYSGTPLSKKLGIKEGSSVAALWAPPDFASLLEPLPRGVRLRSDLRARSTQDVLVAFVTQESELAGRFDRARAKLDPAGGLWIAWPKQSSPLATGLRESHVRAHGLSTGLVDNKICAIDEDWSGLRFVVRVADRPGGSARSGKAR